MARDKKDGVSRTFRLSPDLVKRFDEFSAKTGISKTFLVEQALRRHLDYLEHNLPDGSREW